MAAAGIIFGHYLKGTLFSSSGYYDLFLVLSHSFIWLWLQLCSHPMTLVHFNRWNSDVNIKLLPVFNRVLNLLLIYVAYIDNVHHKVYHMRINTCESIFEAFLIAHSFFLNVMKLWLDTLYLLLQSGHIKTVDTKLCNSTLFVGYFECQLSVDRHPQTSAELTGFYI